MNITATKYIYKNLARTKRIAESPVFKEFSESRRLTVEAPRSPAEANVLARLFKSNPVKNEPPRIIDGFRRLLGVDGPAPKQDAAGDTAQKPEKRKEKPTAENKSKDADVDMDEEMDEENTSGSENERDNSHGEVDIDSDDLAQFDSRLANSDSGSDSGSDSEDDEDDKLDAMSITPSPGPSPGPSDESSREASPEPKKTKPTSSNMAKTPVTSTTFLPSLSMGGYVSASDSESDPDPENADLGGKPQRKNRMGQQARRALWEKKYGAGAKHVQKDMQNKKRDRDSGWDVRRGATSSGGNPREGRGPKGHGPSGQRRPQGQAREKKPEDDKPIHPSWEAARKAKEQKQAGAAAFQGKKVTFD